MRKLLIATSNSGKLLEITNAFSWLPFEILSLKDITDLPQDFEIEESASTYEGNALIKAIILGKRTGLLTLADDSGLEVDVLGGRPGVYSARYAPGSDHDRRQRILEELKDVPEEERDARFRCVLALYDPTKEKVRTCEGVCEGKITLEEKGSNGFGYDPIFINDNYKGKTHGEILPEEKDRISHRARALEKIKGVLQREFLQ